MVDQSSKNKYEQGLGKNAANFTALTPLSFIERTARVFPEHTAVVHGDTVYTAGQVADDSSLDVGGQTAQVLTKIDSLLAEAGSEKAKILKL